MPAAAADAALIRTPRDARRRQITPHPMGYALLFSGQGTQHPLMLPWLDDGAALVATTCAALNLAPKIAVWRSSLQDPAWASCNRNAQVLLTGIHLAAWAQLAPQLPPPAALAGYSVGELAAFSAAGVCTAEDAIALAAARADAMDACARHQPGGLLSVSGLSAPSVNELCAQSGTSLAIDIAPDTAVVGGRDAALSAFEHSATERGAKCSRLNVALASHTPLMHGAAGAFAAVLQRSDLQAPRWPLFADAGAGRVHSRANAAQALAQQIAQTVRWADCLDALHARQPSCVLEIGPGSALAAMWNRRYPEVPARSADEFRSAAAVVDWVMRRDGG